VLLPIVAYTRPAIREEPLYNAAKYVRALCRTRA
jgi:hypothetical protein